jgi:hypothetical protein
MRVSATALTPGVTTLSAAVTSSTAASIGVTSYANMPQTTTFKVMVDSEQMTVTAGFGTATWTVTRGTGGTTAATHLLGATVFQCATTVIPFEPVFFEPMLDRYMPNLVRGSFEKYYETVPVSEHVEFKGVKMPQSYEVLPYLLNWAAKGAVTASVSPVGVSTWSYAPNLTADDLDGMGCEVGNDTAAYHLSACYANQLVLEFVRGTDAAMATVDFVGQMAWPMGAKTPGITRSNLDLVNPAYTALYLDSATIGTTANNDISSVKTTLVNGFQQLFFLNGALYPTGVARPTRALDVEVEQWFDSAAELTNALNTIGAGVERKVRIAATGPVIPTTSTNMGLTLDAYLYWQTFPFKVDKETWHVTYKGSSVYDTTATNSWSMIVVNGVAAL